MYVTLNVGLAAMANADAWPTTTVGTEPSTNARCVEETELPALSFAVTEYTKALLVPDV